MVFTFDTVDSPFQSPTSTSGSKLFSSRSSQTFKLLKNRAQWLHSDAARFNCRNVRPTWVYSPLHLSHWSFILIVLLPLIGHCTEQTVVRGIYRLASPDQNVNPIGAALR